MSLVALGILAHDLDRSSEVAAEFTTDPAQVLARYDLTSDEVDAVLELSAQRLVDLGLNPMVMWNIIGAAGIGWRDLYTHSVSLRKA